MVSTRLPRSGCWSNVASSAHPARIGRLLVLLALLASLAGGPGVTVEAATAITFTAEELLGRPTDTSVTINIVPGQTIEYVYDYDTDSGEPYAEQTALATATGGQPHEVTISGLAVNTRYYYRMRYHRPGETDWVERDEHSFQTQRAEGTGFVFTVTSDSHATFNANHRNAMSNVLSDQPDFHIDLGDTFYSGNASNQTAVNSAYLAYREPLYMDRIGHSIPIFLSAGNHEDEEGWNLDDMPFSPAVGSTQARKAYFPTPIDDGFYTGNTDTLAAIDEATYGDEYREDYYAWEWGDALFVVIDQFQYTMANPYGSAAGEGSDDPDTADQWIWTLGQTQYNWLKQTLENSNAKYKFIFSHHVTGGILRNIVGVDAGYVRGGAEAAAYFEWGGKNADGSAGFEAQRPGWGGVPIHQLLVDNHVSAYFHGHDHQYAYETRDGVVYQEVPSPSMTGAGFANIYSEGDHGSYNTIKVLSGTNNTGHLRITIAPSQATVDYVSSTSTARTVVYSYAIAPYTSGTTYDLTTAVDPTGSGTISPAAGTHTYGEGTVVAVTATPGAGYTFDHWEGDCSGAAVCSVTMDGARSVTAVFTVQVEVAIATSAGGGIKLTWLHRAGAVDRYSVYRSATNPYFEPGGADSTKLNPDVIPPAPGSGAQFPDPVDLGVAGSMYFYAVVPVGEGGRLFTPSNRTGVIVIGIEHDSGP